jgi:hypothetical protein
MNIKNEMDQNLQKFYVKIVNQGTQRDRLGHRQTI